MQESTQRRHWHASMFLPSVDLSGAACADSDPRLCRPDLLEWLDRSKRPGSAPTPRGRHRRVASMQVQRTCSIPSCPNPRAKGRRGWCHGHYKRWYRYGDPLASYPNPSQAERFWPKVDRRGPEDCWEWQGAKNNHGYGWFSIACKARLAHRAAWQLTHGEIPEGQHVLHRCDNPPCCNPAHLWLGTPADNSADRNAKGRTRAGPPLRGERNGAAKLTTSQALEIKRRLAAGESERSIAEDFPVTDSTVHLIAKGQKWAHLMDGAS
jgi:hypothetical protein